jgi:hypothetical protein
LIWPKLLSLFADNRQRGQEALLPYGLCIAIAALGLATVGLLDQPRNGLLISGASVALTAALLMLPPALRPDATLVGVIIALAATLIVATLTNAATPPASYWPSFLLWLTAIATLLVITYRHHLRDLPATLTAALRRYTGEVAVVAGLTAAALAVRVIDLASLPAPFSGDEAGHLLQALRASEGEIRNPFASGLQGQPNAYYFGISGLLQVFGESPFAARLFGALLGTALVPAVYLLLRQLFDRQVALFGAAWVVAYHLAVHFSRQDLNNIADPLVLALVALFLYRALTGLRPEDFVMTGLLAGLGIYLNIGCRVAVPLIGATCLVALISRRASWREQLRGLVYLTGAFLVAAGPLALFWYEHKNEFLNRSRSVGIFESGWLDLEVELTGESKLAILWSQTYHAFGAFGYFQDRIPHYNGPMPLIEHAALAFFLLGAATAVLRLRELRHAILVLLFLGVVVGGGVLTISPPTAQRLLGTIPASAAFVGLGVAAVADRLGRRYDGRAVLAAGVALTLLLVAFNLRYYFVTYANGDYFSDFNTRLAETAGDYARALPAGTTVYWYGAPRVYLTHPSLAYGLRDLPAYEVLEDGRVLPAPDYRPGATAFLVLDHREAELERIIALCPGGVLEAVEYEDGRDLFKAYQAPAATDCASQVVAAAPS